MRYHSKPIILLMADDDLDDQLLVQEAVAEAGVACELRFVANGEELLDYLHRRGAYADADNVVEPDLILLDLNMPIKTGYEALEEIKRDRRLLRIPITILTTSHTHEDIVRSYELGVNSYVTKPLGFNELVEKVEQLYRYWFETATLPSRAEDG